MHLPRDVRVAFRLMRRAPVATTIALLSIALSVGATSIVFSAIKAVLLDRLPYQRAEELVLIGTNYPKAGQSNADWVNWRDIQEVERDNRTLASVGVYRYALFTLPGDAHALPEALYGLRVTAGLFPMLGVSPMLGRNIRPEEDSYGHGEVIILSYGLWSRRFNSDRSIIGRSIRMSDTDCTVIGVMAPGFDFPLRKATPVRLPSPYMEFWAAMQVNKKALEGGLGAVGRMRPGVTVWQVHDELGSIGNRLAREFPATNRDYTLKAAPYRDRLLGSAKNGLWLLMMTAVLFMLIGCSNVANLLLARGLARRREISVRIAIGAGRARIVRQLLTESCVLAALGGLGGFILVIAAWRVLPALVPLTIPRLAAARADWTTFAFALAMAMLNGVLFGIVPALRAGASRQAIALNDFSSRGAAGGPRDRVRSALVTAQVAIAMTLVIVGGQFLGRFIKILSAGPGFDANGLIASVLLASPERYPTPETRAAFYRRVLESVRGLPGVENAGALDALPFSGENNGGFAAGSEAAVMAPGGQLVAEIDRVSSGYLETMGARLVEGRWFRDEEMSEASDVAIINDIAAHRLWPGESALGKRVCVFCVPEKPRQWKRVVGVVSPIRHAALDEPLGSSIYVPGGALEHVQFLVVRSRRPAAEVAGEIRRAVASIDRSQPVFLTATVASFIADSIADRRFIVTLLVALSCVALLMSAGGVYGVIAYATSRRTQEIGIRMALGAVGGDVQMLVFRQGFTAVAAGLAIGLAVALVLARRLATLNPLDVLLAASLVTMSGALACWIPARRATRVDPMSALRHE